MLFISLYAASEYISILVHFYKQMYFLRALLMACDNPAFKKKKPEIMKYPMDALHCAHQTCNSAEYESASLLLTQLLCCGTVHVLLHGSLLSMSADWTSMSPLHFHQELILLNQISSSFLMFLGI